MGHRRIEHEGNAGERPSTRPTARVRIDDLVALVDAERRAAGESSKPRASGIRLVEPADDRPTVTALDVPRAPSPESSQVLAASPRSVPSAPRPSTLRRLAGIVVILAVTAATLALLRFPEARAEALRLGRVLAQQVVALLR